MKYWFRIAAIVLVLTFHLSTRCSEAPCFDALYSNTLKFKLVNQTDKNVIIRSYTRHSPANYAPIDNTTEYVIHSFDPNDEFSKKLGPKYIDNTIYLHSTLEINAKDSLIFVQKRRSFTKSSQNCFDRPECTLGYDIGVKYHVYAEFDAVYPFPQLDSIVIEFEDKKSLSFVLKSRDERFQQVDATGIKPNIFDKDDYEFKQEISEEKNEENCDLIDLIDVYTITEDHYKEAR